LDLEEAFRFPVWDLAMLHTTAHMHIRIIQRLCLKLPTHLQSLRLCQAI
jgi:hypothetical protein